MPELSRRRDLTVTRIDGTVVKTALTPEGEVEIRTELRCLTALAGTGFAPACISSGPRHIVMEDVGDGESVTDETLFFENCVRLLLTFRHLNICHGDLTSRNIIVRGNRPIALDFGEAVPFDGTPKRAGSDAYWLWSAAAAIQPSRPFLRWKALRDSIDLNGRKVLDLGCHAGLLTAAAAAEGALARGVDVDGGALDRARRWELPFTEADLLSVEYARGHMLADVVFLLSVWPYLVGRHGQSACEAFFGYIVSYSSVVFFESQLIGDGPGVMWSSDEELEQWLMRFGRPKQLVRLPVEGRQAMRSLWVLTAHPLRPLRV